MSKKAHETALPKLRFPEFREKGEWEILPLGELINGVSNKNRNKKISRVFTNSAVSGIIDQRDYFDKDIATAGNTDNYSVIELGDYVYNPRISESAPVGPTSRNKLGQGMVSPLYTVFRFRDSNNNEFYDYYFGSIHWQNSLKAIGNSGARHDRMGISLTQLRLVKVPHPSPEEQQKIAAALSSLDALLTAQTAKLQALQAHKRGLMQDLFPAAGETVPKRRFPEFQDADEWKEGKLGELCEVLNNRRKPITGSLRQKGQYPYYGASGIVDYVKDFIFDERLLLIGEDGAKWGAYEKTAFIVTGKYWVNNHAHVLRPSKINATLLEQYLVKLDLGPFVAGAAPPKLTLGKLKEIPIPVPSTQAEQQKIADCLYSLDNLITAQSQKIDALKLHKKGLMQALFPAASEPNA